MTLALIRLKVMSRIVRFFKECPTISQIGTQYGCKLETNFFRDFWPFYFMRFFPKIEIYQVDVAGKPKCSP
jgi:hypothetical protein